MVEADALLAQHPQEALLGPVLRVVVAAEVGDPAGGFAQHAVGPAPRRGRAGRVQSSSAGGRAASRPQFSAISREAVSSGSASRTALVQQRGVPALAQPAGGEHHARRARRAQEAAHGHRREGQVAQALQRRARHPLQRLARGGHHHAGQVARLFPPQHVVVDDGERVAGLRDVHPRQRAPRAAHQVEVAPLARRRARAASPAPPRRRRGRAPGRRRRARPGGWRRSGATRRAAPCRRRPAPVPASRRRGRPARRPRRGSP